MPTRLEGRSDQRTTDHGDEIHALRAEARRLRNLFTGDDDLLAATAATRGRIAANDGAASLLEAHDATLISLDDWQGPADLVNVTLSRIGRGSFMPNGS